jgi:putative FmdB family regulatory protein
MPTYEYECKKCGHQFERHQRMEDKPLSHCPQCGGRIERLISGGSGFILKGSGFSRKSMSSCSLEQSGATCCGLDQRCGTGSCGD